MLLSFLLFFVACVLCKKNYSFSRVVFFRCKFTSFFYSKINDSSGPRTTGFSSSRSGFESLSCQIFFLISLTFVTNSYPMVPMAQWVKQQGSEAEGAVSRLCRTKYFLTFLTFVRNYNGYHGIVGRTTAF